MENLLSPAKVYIYDIYRYTDSKGRKCYDWQVTTDQNKDIEIRENFRLASLNDLDGWFVATEELFFGILEVQEGIVCWVVDTYWEFGGWIDDSKYVLLDNYLVIHELLVRKEKEISALLKIDDENFDFKIIDRLSREIDILEGLLDVKRVA